VGRQFGDLVRQLFGRRYDQGEWARRFAALNHKKSNYLDFCVIFHDLFFNFHHF
jgi:hypothetical protein